MIPTKFWLNPTYHSGADVVWRFSSWPLWPPCWIREQNDFSNSESLCLPNAPQDVSAWYDLTFGSRCHLNIVKMAAMSAILDNKMEQFSQFWISMLLWCLPLSFGSIQLKVWEDMLFEEFQDGRLRSHPGYLNGKILAILTLHVSLRPHTKFRLKWTYHSRRDVVWRISRWRQ